MNEKMTEMMCEMCEIELLGAPITTRALSARLGICMSGAFTKITVFVELGYLEKEPGTKSRADYNKSFSKCGYHLTAEAKKTEVYQKMAAAFQKVDDVLETEKLEICNEYRFVLGRFTERTDG